MSTWFDLKQNPRLKQIYDARLIIIRSVREFFWSKKFMEMETPIAVRLASQEPYLHPLSVRVHDQYNAETKFYLRTSPEFALKKLLAVGYEKVFEIGKCFRDHESFGGNHNTEFTMIEWYRAPGSLFEIMDDVESLFAHVLSGLGKTSLVYKKQEIDAQGAWDRKTMKEIWREYIQVDLDAYLDRESIAVLARQKGYAVADADAYEDIFYKIFLTEIEPKLGKEKPVFVYDFPAILCSLSKLCAHDTRYAERFELYVGGLEVANAFGELTDATRQYKQLQEDVEKRRLLGKETWEIDPDFIAALADLPDSALNQAGIALGLDRMVVLCTGAQDINEVIFQSMRDQTDPR